MIIATWNVRTMLDNDGRTERWTALIARELQFSSIDIAALPETRFEAQGQLQEADYIFFWIGQTEGPRTAGVTFAIRNSITRQLESLPAGVSPRLMTLGLPLGKKRYLSQVNVYAPTMYYNDEDKEAFYHQLTEVLQKVPKEDKLFILGDFNAGVGTDCATYADF